MAENNNGELQLKITLDDGSIVQGFLNIEKKAKDTGAKVEQGFNKGFDAVKDGLDQVAPQATALGSRIATALSSPLGLVTASIVALGAAFKSAFDLTLEGEKLNKLDKQFNSLASSFGVAGDALKSKFIDSLGGLTDDSDAIQSLNKAFVTLGDKVTQLPQIMELARKATNLFGGDVTDNFEKINQAIATGATRQLRGLGLVIDADKAYEKYAKTLGISKEVLSEAGKQQAIINAIIEKSGKTYANVALEVGGFSSALQRLKVVAQNSFEEIQKSTASSLGPALERITNKLTEMISKGPGLQDLALVFFSTSSAAANFAGKIGSAGAGLDVFSLSAKDLEKKIGDTQEKIGKFQDTIDSLSTLKDGSSDQTVIGRISTDIENVKLKSQEANKELQTLFKALSQKKGADDPSSTLPQKGLKPDNSKDINLEEEFKLRQKREAELSAFLLSQDQTRLQNKIQQNTLLLNENSTATQKLSVMNDNFNIQDQLREEQKNQAITAIKEKYRLEKQTGSLFEQQSLAAIDENFFQQKLLVEQTRVSQLKAIQEQANFDSLKGFDAVGNGFSQIADGAGQAAKNFAANSNAAFKQVGAQAFSILSQGVGKAFNNFGAALKNGEDAGAAFADALGESLIQIASQFGDTFIQLGIGKLAASYGADATGYTLIAAGAALKILAGFAGGKKSAPASSSAGDSGGGGISSQPNFTDNPATNLERKQADTNVQVYIQGDILDSDESGSRVVELINNAFDKKGVVINRGAVA